MFELSFILLNTCLGSMYNTTNSIVNDPTFVFDLSKIICVLAINSLDPLLLAYSSVKDVSRVLHSESLFVAITVEINA